MILILKTFSTFLLILSQASEVIDSVLKERPEDPDHLMEYVIKFNEGMEDEEAFFEATLTNRSDAELQLLVNDQKFWGKLVISDPAGEAVRAYLKSYRTIRLIGVADVPFVEIPAKKSLHWKIPLSSLAAGQGIDVSREFLNGKNVVSVMMVQVLRFGESSKYLSQESNRIEIPGKK